MIASRIARPTRCLARSIEFYRERLGPTQTGGPADPSGWSDEDLQCCTSPIRPRGSGGPMRWPRTAYRKWRSRTRPGTGRATPCWTRTGSAS